MQLEDSPTHMFLLYGLRLPFLLFRWAFDGTSTTFFRAIFFGYAFFGVVSVGIPRTIELWGIKLAFFLRTSAHDRNLTFFGCNIKHDSETHLHLFGCKSVV